MAEALKRHLMSRVRTYALALAALAAAMLATEAVLVANAEVETHGHARDVEGDGYVAYVWTASVQPGDIVRIPPLFAGQEKAPPVELFLVEGGEGEQAAAQGTVPHVYGDLRPGGPGLDVRRPAPPEGVRSHALDFVFRADTTNLSANETQTLQDNLISGGPFWPFSGPGNRPSDRILILSSARLALASFLRIAEVVDVVLLASAVFVSLRQRSQPSEDSPTDAVAERLARVSSRAVDYLKSVRAYLLLCGLVTFAAMYFGLVALFYVLEDPATVPAGAEVPSSWEEQTIFLVAALAVLLGVVWGSQLWRVHREIARLRRIQPPAMA